MKTKIVQILFILICTVFAAALQDLSPSFGGVKPPLLPALTLFWAFSERRRTPWILSALMSGSFENSLSAFPTGCATGFLLLAGFSARLIRATVQNVAPPVLGLVAVMIAAPLHEVWLSVWGVAGNNPSVLVRFFASALPAAPVGIVTFVLMPFIEHHIGFHGAPVEKRRLAA